jgi:hypothetical protein
METPNLYYITIATKPHAVLENLKRVVEKNGESLIVLGGQEDRRIGWDSHGNFGIKLREVYDFIHRADIGESDIILFTDAYDVAYCGRKQTLLERYLAFSKPIVFGCELYCNPMPELATQYAFRSAEFPYLNSGLFIGRAAALRTCMSGYVYNDKHDDQLFWTRKFFSHPDLIELDYNNALFLNTAGFDDTKFLWDAEENLAYYKEKTPIFVHVNAPDKSPIRSFLRQP